MVAVIGWVCFYAFVTFESLALTYSLYNFMKMCCSYLTKKQYKLIGTVSKPNPYAVSTFHTCAHAGLLFIIILCHSKTNQIATTTAHQRRSNREWFYVSSICDLVYLVVGLCGLVCLCVTLNQSHHLYATSIRSATQQFITCVPRWLLKWLSIHFCVQE